MRLFLHDAQKPQASQACWVSAEWGAQSVGHLQHHQALWEECYLDTWSYKGGLGSTVSEDAFCPVQCNMHPCFRVPGYPPHSLWFCSTWKSPQDNGLGYNWGTSGGESQSWKQKTTRDSLALSKAVSIPSSQFWVLIPGVPERLTLLEHLNFLSSCLCLDQLYTVPNITVCITNIGGI